jgi:hypothetical protein
MSSSGKRTIRLALLLCDTPIDTVRASHGTYTDVFQSYLSSSLQTSGFADDDGEGAKVAMEMKSYDVVEKGEFPGEDELEGLDGVVLTGSGEFEGKREQGRGEGDGTDRFGILLWTWGVQLLVLMTMRSSPGSLLCWTF